MRVRIAESAADLERISDVLLQLRDGFDRDGLIARIEEQRRNGYRIAYVESGGEVLCVAGFVVGTKLAWGRHDHPEVAREYEALKLRLAADFPRDRVAYTRGKTEFILRVTEEARRSRGLA